MMHVANTVGKQLDEAYSKFLEKHGEVKEKTEEGTTYTLQIEDIANAKKIARERQHYRNSLRLIPRNFIISLVSQYDSFLGRIIRFMFAAKPELLNASEKALSYTQMMNFRDLNDAKEFIVEKEIESIIRKSHAEQFEWLKEKLNTPFNKDLPCWPQFIELTERRNLFVHTDGKISSQYLAVCAKHKHHISEDLAVGESLEVPREYFESAYQCIYEIGIKLAHVIWRRLCPDRLKESDAQINNVTFELVQKKEYDIAIRILDFFTGKNVSHAEDSYRRIMLINRAQAYKWKGDAGQCIAILDAEDWSACEDKFKLAVAVLHDDFEKCYTLVKRLKDDPEFHKTSYKDWPIFRELRRQKEFQDLYRECYNEDLTVEQTTEDDEQEKQEPGAPASER